MSGNDRTQPDKASNGMFSTRPYFAAIWLVLLVSVLSIYWWQEARLEIELRPKRVYVGSNPTLSANSITTNYLQASHDASS